MAIREMRCVVTEPWDGVVLRCLDGSGAEFIFEPAPEAQPEIETLGEPQPGKVIGGERGLVSRSIDGDVGRRGNRHQDTFGETGQDGVRVAIDEQTMQSLGELHRHLELHASGALVSDLLIEPVVIRDGDVLTLDLEDRCGQSQPAIHQILTRSSLDLLALLWLRFTDDTG